ncbi:hypothetical protein HEP87_58865 [Streptomyces sp. S1D4-11]
MTEEGGGRVDVAAAALGPVTATGSVALGPYGTGGDDNRAPRTATVRYTNTSDKDLTLALAAHLATTGGRDLATGALRLGSDAVRIAAGATVDVPLTVDPSRAGRGDYYGYVTATTTDGAVKVHTTVSIVVHGPIHKLTVTTYDHDGNRVQALPTIWGTDGFVDYVSTEPAVAEVEEGTYQLDYSSLDTADDGQELRQVVLPEVKVTKDTAVTLDARKTTKVDIRTPRPAEQRGILDYQTYRQIDGHSLLQGTMYFDLAKRLYVSPTAAVTDGTFEFASRWQLVAPLLEAKVSGSDLALNPYYMPNSPLFAALRYHPDRRGRGHLRRARLQPGPRQTRDCPQRRGHQRAGVDPTGGRGGRTRTADDPLRRHRLDALEPRRRTRRRAGRPHRQGSGRRPARPAEEAPEHHRQIHRNGEEPVPLRRHADVVPTDTPAGRVHRFRAQQRGVADHVRRQRRSALGQ